MKKILLFPGAFRKSDYYLNKYEVVEIWGDYHAEVPEAEIYVGHCLGCSYVCDRADCSNKKIIFINPIILPISSIKLISRWIKYAIKEKVNPSKTVSIKKWPACLFHINHLRQVNILETLKKLPKENVFIIRGNKDNFFCDKEAARMILENNFNLIEVNTGHNWNENIDEAIKGVLQKFEQKKVPSEFEATSGFLENTFFPTDF